MPDDLRDRIREFTAARSVAVIGASKDRAKFGNRVLRTWLDAGRQVQCVHPREESIEGVDCVSHIADLERPVDVLSVITPPGGAVSIVEQAVEAGIQRLWFQPGASSAAAIERAAEFGVATLQDGPCVLVELG